MTKLSSESFRPCDEECSAPLKIKHDCSYWPVHITGNKADFQESVLIIARIWCGLIVIKKGIFESVLFCWTIDKRLLSQVKNW